MTHAVGQEVADVPVGEAVVHHPASSAPRYDAALPQQSKLVAQSRLADPEEESQVANAELVGSRGEGVKDTRTRGIAKRGEYRRDALGRVRVQDPAEQRLDPIRMNALDRAAVRRQREVL